MGFCAEPTPEMGDYSIEVRRESFWLRCPTKPSRMFAPGPIHSVELTTEDIPRIRAALDQVERIEGGEKS